MARLLGVLLASVTLASGVEQQECDSDSLSALQTPTLLATGRSGADPSAVDVDKTAASSPGGSKSDVAQPAEAAKAFQNVTLADFKAALDALSVEPIRSDELDEDMDEEAPDAPADGDKKDEGGVGDWDSRRRYFDPRRRYNYPRRRSYDDSRRRYDNDGRRRSNDSRRRGHHGNDGETCCMCSNPLEHLGTLLYAAGDYDHDFGAHNARWHCEHVCQQQCDWMGHGRMFGCYDEDHIIQVNNNYLHRSGWNIWQETHGNIC